MTETYRNLKGCMSPVDVDRPHWASSYAVGDTIYFESPPDGDVRGLDVVGFSSRKEHYGQPVILADDDLAACYADPVNQIVINEDRHVPASEVTDRD